MLTQEELAAIADRLEGWELVEFLQVSIQDILSCALQDDWINEDNVEDVKEFVGLRS